MSGGSHIRPLFVQTQVNSCRETFLFPLFYLNKEKACFCSYLRQIVKIIFFSTSIFTILYKSFTINLIGQKEIYVVKINNII